MDANKNDKVKDKNKEQTPLKKVLNVIYYVVLVLIIVVSLFYTFMTFSTKNGVTSMFGYVFSSVQTDSMSGTFEAGDVIVIKEIDANDIQPEKIIAFHYVEPNSGQKIIVTHRVIRLEGGKIITQGDVARNNNSVDKIEYVSYGDVVGEYTNVKLSGVGKVVDFLKTKEGFFFCVLVPVFLFLFWQIYVFIKTLLEARSIDNKKKINDEARAIAEQMLKEMQQQQTPSSGTPPNESADSQEQASPTDEE